MMKTKTQLAACALISLLVSSVSAQVTVTSVLTNGLSEPYNVSIDVGGNVYATDSANNRIIRIDKNTQAVTTLAGIPTDAAGSNDGPPYLAHFNDPQGMILVNLGGTNGLLVADNANNLIRFVRLSDGTVSTVSGRLSGGPAVNATGALATFLYPVGMDQDDIGNVYIADWGNNTIRVMNLNDPVLGVTNLVITGTTLYRPTAIAFAGTNQSGARVLWIADTGNQMVKQITLNISNAVAGTMTTYLGAYRTTGTADSSFGPSARFNGPSGLLWSGRSLIVSDTLNNSIRLVTNYTAFGATNYAVITYAGVPGSSGFVDGSPLSAKFNSPYGIITDVANNGFLLADLKNNALRRIQLGPPLPAVPAPRVGWIDFTKPPQEIVSILRVNAPFVFNNDVKIAIDGTDGTLTHFTSGPTPSDPLNDTIPNPDLTTGTTPPVYHDGLFPSQVALIPSIVQSQPDVTVKAIGVQAGRQNSPVVTARFQFKTANPSIDSENAAGFNISDETLGAQMWYTTDGTDPTNAAPSVGPFGSPSSITLPRTGTNITFKVRGFRRFPIAPTTYIDSDTVIKIFSPSNFVPNQITFGFGSGEASSDFQASPGQFFYAPVTLSVLPQISMYSLQFNVTVTNSPASPTTTNKVESGAVSFTSALMKTVPAFSGDHLPPGSSIWYKHIDPAMFGGLVITSNIFGTNIIVTTNTFFQSLLFTNSTDNLLGVGWAERFGLKNLYDTTLQDVIKFSIAHDTLFNKGDGRVVLGAYTFKVPTNANNGDKYRIQIGRPSATSDGVGAPGSDVFIATNDMSTIDVTVNPRNYIAGDVYPFRWFNAGDFGKGCLNNADVMQVFQTAVYGIDPPPPFSDFNAALDTCCGTGVTNGNDVFQQGGTTTSNNVSVFGGDDSTINTFPFGDGQLDITDVYVTYRRSLDPSLTWWQRYWTVNGLAARTTANVACFTNSTSSTAQPSGPRPLVQGTPAVTFVAGDAVATAGQTLQIPITAKVSGGYPLRVLGLNVTVQPLDGSPEVTQQVQFTPVAGLGQPTLSASKGSANYVGAWLNSGVSGISGTSLAGTLQVTIPANAPASAAYAIRFDHVSASPNGFAAFPKHTQTGLITLADRSTSTYGDGIPDSWRLRYFGTVNNLLSQAVADADGDGASNWQEYVAGTDPTDQKSSLRVSTTQAPAPPGNECVIHWPSIAGRTYVIERSSSLASPNWTAISTNAGTGTEIEFHDATGGNQRFYRVHVQ